MEANDTFVILDVKAFGTFDTEFVIEALPDAEDIPEGGM